MTQFLQEWKQFLSHICTTTPSQLYILGDMNIHFDNPDIPNNKQIKNIMAGFDLKQHIYVPTHTNEHTIDLLFTRDEPVYPLLKSISVTDLRISDHYCG